MAAPIELPYGSHRCVGALAAAVVVGNSTTKRERFHVPGATGVSVRAKCSAVTSDPTVQIIPQLHAPGIDKDDGTTADVATGLTTATALTTSEVLHSIELLGDDYVDVEVNSDSGDSATITYVDVFVKRGAKN